MRKFWFFFYGLPNIFGLALSLVGLLLQLALLMFTSSGLAAILWIPLCLGLYAIGWLMGLWVQDNDADLQFAQTLDAQQIEMAMQNLLVKIKGRIPEAAFVHVQNIEASVLSVLPHLVSGQFANQDLHTVKQAVFDYLPTTLENYLRLPTPYANFHPIEGDKTAKQILIEQLMMLENSLVNITHSIYKNDAQALLTNQRFLQTRLGKQDTFI